MGDELMELPEGWLWVKTGEICEGIVPGRTKPRDFSGTIPWITLPDVIDLHISRSQSNLTVTREGAEEVGMKVMPKGTVLMSCVGQFGIICIAEDEVVPNQQFHGFICPANVLPEYVAYALMTEIDQITQMASATTIAYINKTKCNSIQIPLAPSNEQKRIVAQIEALRERSQKAKAALEAIPELCDRFRQSVLTAAFRGDLTADWREENPDVEPASVLLERIRIERFNNWERNENRKALFKGTQLEKGKNRKYVEPVTPENSIEITTPESWLLVSADQITFLITDGKHGDCRDETNSGYFFLSVKDLYERRLHYENARQIQEQDFQEVHYRTNLEVGDVLVTNAGTIGRVAVARESDKVSRTTFQKSIAVLKPIKEVVHPDYLAMFIESSVSQLNKKSSGTAVKNLLLRDLKEFTIALPPLMEQIEIVCRVEKLLAFAERLETNYQNAYLRFDRLNQSILAKAFRGELVEQDPNDEPASVLLDRIRAEREAQQPTKKSPRKGTTGRKKQST